jgi:hypothetical protein
VASFRLKNLDDNPQGNYWTIRRLLPSNPWAGVFMRENTPVEGARSFDLEAFLSVKWVRVPDKEAA